jgi:hypothetical protein
MTGLWAYPGSSCRSYALGVGDPLLTEAPCYMKLSPDLSRRPALWQDFRMGEDVH